MEKLDSRSINSMYSFTEDYLEVTLEPVLFRRIGYRKRVKTPVSSPRLAEVTNLVDIVFVVKRIRNLKRNWKS